jgi:hypothetical protein
VNFISRHCNIPASNIELKIICARIKEAFKAAVINV